MAEPTSLNYVVAGMLSTIDYIPSQAHPEEMMGLAEKIIHHVNIAGGLIPYDNSDGPFEVREGPATGKSTRMETR